MVLAARILGLSDGEMAGQVKHRDAAASCLGHVLDLKRMFGNPRRLCTEGTQRLCPAIEKNNAPDPVKLFLLIRVASKIPIVMRNESGMRQGCL